MCGMHFQSFGACLAILESFYSYFLTFAYTLSCGIEKKITKKAHPRKRPLSGSKPCQYPPYIGAPSAATNGLCEGEKAYINFKWPTQDILF